MYTLVVLGQAEKRLQEAYYWYEDKSVGLGDRFLEEIESVFKFIEEEPKSCSIKYNEMRTARSTHFPYLAHYFIDTKNKKVVVTTVRHTSQHPLYKE